MNIRGNAETLLLVTLQFRVKRFDYRLREANEGEKICGSR